MSEKSNVPEQASKTFREMMTLLGFQIEITDTKQDRAITLFVNTDDPGRLIGRKGKYLESAEHLLNSMLKREGGDIPRVSIDVDGYDRESHNAPREAGGPAREGTQRTPSSDRSERTERPRANTEREDVDPRILTQARDLAKEVKQWGEPKTLGPLGAKDRQAVHKTLGEDNNVRTESGEEDERGRKTITILPADDHK
ncbi:MAG: KH domain-containing protein [Verrucomicrobiota bacterium]